MKTVGEASRNFSTSQFLVNTLVEVHIVGWHNYASLGPLWALCSCTGFQTDVVSSWRSSTWYTSRRLTDACRLLSETGRLAQRSANRTYDKRLRCSYSIRSLVTVSSTWISPAMNSFKRQFEDIFIRALRAARRSVAVPYGKRPLPHSLTYLLTYV